MKRQLGLIFAAVTLAIGVAAPLRVEADSADRSYRIATRIVEQRPGAGEFDGTLQLNVSSDGIVSGYYRPEDDPRFISVTGGITGERFWLDIGSFSEHPWQFTGSFHHGNIDATSNGLLIDNGRSTDLELLGVVTAK